MEYTKPPLTFDAQAELLLSRGLQADIRDIRVTYDYPFLNFA